MAKRIYLASPHMGGKEKAYVDEAFDSNFIAPVGPQLDQFEQRFCDMFGFRYAVAVSSGTAAIHLALRGLEIGEGDVVIGSTLTFIGSISPVVFQGATPVLMDCDESSWNLDPNLLEDEIKKMQRSGEIPAAVVPTDLYGQSCDIDAIRSICDPLGIPVIIDSAEALGAEYRGRPAGSGGRAAVFSFNGNKIITTSGGGMLVSDDEEVIANALYLSTQAREPVVHFEHNVIGYNYRMSNICAAIGLGQLEVLEDRIEKKLEIFEAYRKGLADLPGISFMPEASYGRSTRWLTVVLVDPEKFGTDRETIRLALEEENIESRPVWKPMHCQKAFSGVRVVGGKIAETFFEKGLCLPSGTTLEESDLDQITGIIRNLCSSG